MADISTLNEQVEQSIVKIDKYVKNPSGTAPLDDELNELLRKMNAASNEITDEKQIKEHVARIERLKQKYGEYDIARNSIQSKTRTDLIGVAGANKEVKDAVENIKELNMNTIEAFLRFSNLIIDRFTGPDRITMQSIRGSYLLEKISAAGFTYGFTAKGIEVQSTDPSRSQKAAEATLAIDTLIKTGVLSLDELKQGLLYATPSFGTYAESSRLPDGTPNSSAKMQDYMAFLQKKPQTELTLEEKSILASQGAMSTIKVPELIRSYQNLGQMGTAIAVDPDLARQAQKLAESGVHIPAPKEAPPGMIQGGANTVAEKASDLVGRTAENIGDFTAGTLKAIGKAFDKSPIGGMVVAVLAVFAGWKFLTGDWGVGKMKAPGWVIALVAAGGAAAMDMAKAMGYDMEDVKGAAEKTGKTVKGAAEKVAGTQKGGSDDATVEPEKDATQKPATKPAESKDLSPSQLEATKKVSEDTRISGLFSQKKEKYTATKDVYTDFINKELGDKPLSVFLSPKEPKHSIISSIGVLDPSITLPAGVDPAIMKDILRLYLLGLSLRPSELTGATDKINATISKLDTTKDTVRTGIAKIYGISEQSQESISKKILSYNMVMDGKVLSKDNLKIEIKEAVEGGYIAKIAVIDASKLKTDIPVTSVEPFHIDFDEHGKLETTSLKITAQAGLKVSVDYKLSQNNNQILIQKA